MKVELIDDYVLTTDPYNFILNKKGAVQKGENKGKETLTVIGYHSSLISVFEALLNEKIHDSNARTLNGLVRDYQTLIEELRKLFPKVKDVIS
jgi:hypothetical protein